MEKYRFRNPSGHISLSITLFSLIGSRTIVLVLHESPRVMSSLSPFLVQYSGSHDQREQRAVYH